MRFPGALLLLAAAGCTSSNKGGAAPSPQDAGDPPPPPVSASCDTQAEGRVLSTVSLDGGVMLVFVRVSNGVNVGVNLPAPTQAVDCSVLTQGAVSVVKGAHADGVSPLSVVTTPGGRWMFYTRAHGFQTDGFGVAPLDADAGAFVPSSSLLWTADRPQYGTASLEQGGFVYAYGCLGFGFLDAHCFVARVPNDQAANESAYTYYEGGGHWTARVDDAWPIMEAGQQVSVHFDAPRNRFIAIYSKPLDNVLRMRTGLAPEGPWSAEYAVASCRHPEADPQTFCANVVAQPWMPVDGNTGVTVAYSASSFQPTAPVPEYSTRMAVVPFPDALP